MTFYTGNDGDILIGAQAIGEITRWTLRESAEAIPGPAMGDSFEKFKGGRPTSSGTFDYNLDDGDTLGQGALAVGSEVTLNLRARGTASGRPEATVTALITELSEEVADGQANSGTCTWVGNSLVDRMAQV